MALSLLVLLIPIFLLVVAYRVLFNGDAPANVDPTPALQSAQRAGITQLPPATPPEGWSIVQAQFRDGVLRIGYVTQAREEVQLVESKADLAATELPRQGETRFIGRSGDTTIVLLAKGADVTPLARTLPIPIAQSGVPQ
jgi:Protein of unknown function (DUF4245)